jgi:hypothetical protein
MGGHDVMVEVKVRVTREITVVVVLLVESRGGLKVRTGVMDGGEALGGKMLPTGTGNDVTRVVTGQSVTPAAQSVTSKVEVSNIVSGG